MSKMNELSMLLDDLIKHGEGIIEIAKEMKSMFSSETTTLSEKKEEKTISFTDLRARLAEKSRDGFTADIKAILLKYGAEKLSAIQPSNYENVLNEVEALTHE